MTCEELRDQYELYAIGVAEEPERSEIRQHLNRGCEVCMTGMKRAREVGAILGGTAAPAAPSAPAAPAPAAKPAPADTPLSPPSEFPTNQPAPTKP